MRALREPDAFPAGDIALIRALGLTTARELEQRAEQWRPWRAYAAMYLWSVPDRQTADGEGVARVRTDFARDASQTAGI